MKANFYDFDDTLAVQNWASLAKNELAIFQWNKVLFIASKMPHEIN